MDALGVVSGIFLGLGPLEPILRNEGISEILVNGAENVSVEKNGRLVLSDVKFRSETRLRLIIDRIVTRVSRRMAKPISISDPEAG